MILIGDCDKTCVLVLVEKRLKFGSIKFFFSSLLISRPCPFLFTSLSLLLLCCLHLLQPHTHTEWDIVCQSRWFEPTILAILWAPVTLSIRAMTSSSTVGWSGSCFPMSCSIRWYNSTSYLVPGGRVGGGRGGGSILYHDVWVFDSHWVTKVMDLPDRPARAVRPTLWI